MMRAGRQVVEGQTPSSRSSRSNESNRVVAAASGLMKCCEKVGTLSPPTLASGRVRRMRQTVEDMHGGDGLGPEQRAHLAGLRGGAGSRSGSAALGALVTVAARRESW